MGIDYNVPKVIAETGDQVVSDTALLLEDFTDFTTANVLASSRLWLVVNDGIVRLFYGGATPTTSEGNVILPGQDLLLSGSNNLANFKIIRDGGNDAEVAVTLEG